MFYTLSQKVTVKKQLYVKKSCKKLNVIVFKWSSEWVSEVTKVHLLLTLCPHELTKTQHNINLQLI